MILIRIISGKYRGFKLKIPPDYDIRPTQDRVKESIFNVLGQNIEGSRVLDLFSGSGSLGIESISRGASLVFFVDQHIKAIRLIKHNIEILNDIESEYRIIRKDAVSFLNAYRGTIFDIVFIDPPYKIAENNMKNVFRLLKNKTVIDADTIMVYEYFSRRDISAEVEGLKVVKNSSFGDKIVSYICL
ncbi:MAG: 16S rRNA (guanine(966)-N(2))-methyltransferase RsmD [Actinobacteria bacterium]|nr:16S rRNA (guanine(966)-N(2))-methyltransferase RsmD [Actinomycetota bacterium]